MLKKKIKSTARKFGVSLSSNYDQDRQQHYINILEKFALIQPKKEKENTAVLIIFSKDRAMQLEALLRSYFFYVKNPIPVRVLYYASEEKFKNGYEKLIHHKRYQTVEFIQEKSFKKDLVHLFENENSSKVIFMVDDIFFKNDIDFNDFISIETKEYVASLRMGKHLNFAYTLQQKQELPKFIIDKHKPEMLSWEWREAQFDWGYPISVDGHLFNVDEFRILVKELNYTAPNSFEEALQLMHPLFSKRLGLCYPDSIIINNPCNKVQTENDNISGELTVEELNEKWLSGKRIAFEKHKGLQNKSAHQELTIEFIEDES